MPTIKVKMNQEQYYTVLSVINRWDEDKDLCGMVELPHTPKEELDKCIVHIRTSGILTFDLWNQFCEEIGMKIQFPGY